MSLGKKLRFAANPAEVFVVARAAAVLAAIPPLLKFADIEKIVRTLTPARPRAGDAALPRERVTYLCHRTFGLAGRMSYRPNCLRRALVQYHCLRLHGVPAVIQFGVKTDEGTLAGHCWLTVDGTLYDERADMVSQFTQMFALPAPEKHSMDGGTPGAGPPGANLPGADPPAANPPGVGPRDVKRLSFGG
jgi:hypothetical protein